MDMKTLDAEMLAVLEEEQTLADAAVLSEYDEGFIPLPEWRDRERAVREARRVVVAKARHGRLVARERLVGCKCEIQRDAPLCAHEPGCPALSLTRISHYRSITAEAEVLLAEPLRRPAESLLEGQTATR